jgi:hypothetical protein
MCPGRATLGKGALNGGMPLYKYIFNRALTFFENVLLRQKLAEYHTGYRAFAREILQRVNYEVNNEDFVYGLGVLRVSIVHRLCKWGVMKSDMYTPRLDYPDAAQFHSLRQRVKN